MPRDTCELQTGRSTQAHSDAGLRSRSHALRKLQSLIYSRKKSTLFVATRQPILSQSNANFNNRGNKMKRNPAGNDHVHRFRRHTQTTTSTTTAPKTVGWGLGRERGRATLGLGETGCTTPREASTPRPAGDGSVPLSHSLLKPPPPKKKYIYIYKFNKNQLNKENN